MDFPGMAVDNRAEALANTASNSNHKPVSAPGIEALEDARAALAGARVWLVTDGKAGDLAQCQGIAECLRLRAESRIVRPRAPWAWAMPHLWRWPALGIDPAEAPGRSGGPLEAPFPDLVIASGRRAAAYLPAISRASGGRSFTVFLKDPRTGGAIADFLWVPEHDRLRGGNVMTTLLSPHRLSPEALAEARARTRLEILALPRPRVAVLLGGDSKDMRYQRSDSEALAKNLVALVRAGASLMATPSRRTSFEMRDCVGITVQETGGFFWDGTGENPYRELIANADALVVTRDSVNMVGEACATGRPVMVFPRSGGSRKIERFLKQLEAAGATHPFSGRLETCSYAPMDATPAIAIELARRYVRFRQGVA